MSSSRPSLFAQTIPNTSAWCRFLPHCSAIAVLTGACFTASSDPDANGTTNVEPTTTASTNASTTDDGGTAETTTGGGVETAAESSTGSDDGPFGESTGNDDLGCEGLLDGETRPCGSDVGQCSAGTQVCEAGTWTRCDATPPGVETCDDAFVDEDCDGTANEDCPSCAPGDTTLGSCTQFGACEGNQQTCDASGRWSECSIQPGIELCSTGTDEDCDGATDEEDCEVCLPGDEQMADCPQLGDCSGNVQTCDASGSWSACEFAPTAEVCGGGDEDCDGLTNEADAGTTWYADLDDDGFHDASAAIQSCTQPANYISLAASDGEDCEDLNEFVQTQCILPPMLGSTNHSCPMPSTQITYRDCPNHYDLDTGSTVLISGGGFYSAQEITWSALRENGYIRLTQDCNFLEATTLLTTLNCVAHEYD